jgi:hypothetical protein
MVVDWCIDIPLKYRGEHNEYLDLSADDFPMEAIVSSMEDSLHILMICYRKTIKRVFTVFKNKYKHSNS